MKVRLGDVCSFFSGTGFPNIYQGQKTGKYPIYKVGDISKNVLFGNRELIFSDNYIDDDTVKAIKGTVLPPKTVVFAKIGEALKLNRRAITGCYCLIDNNAMGILADNSVLDELYFYYFMCSVDLQHYCESTAVPSVRKARISEIEIPLPPLDEQRRIAAVLDKVSDLIAKRRAQLDKLDDLVKARFVEMFGDPYINSMAWKKIKIKAAVTVEPQNGMYKPQSDYVTDGSGIPILRIDGFYDGAVTDFSSLKRLRCNDNEKQKYLLNENDIVINRVNSIEYLGKCAHITGLIEETVYESNMMRMHFDPVRFNPVYVTHLLCSRFVYDQVINHAKKAVNQASINQKDVLDFDIYQPSIERQNVFADFVNRADQSKLTIQQSLDKLEILKKALMQEYFG